MIDIKKLLQHKEELKEVYEYLGITAEFPDQQVRLFLLDYPKDMIESAFKVLAEKEQKVDDPVKYLAAVLRNSKAQGMTPEERAAQISELRAGAARVKAHKQHLAKVKAEKEAFAMLLQKDAEVCRDLQPVCRNLQDVPVLVPVQVSVSLPLSVHDAVAVPASKPTPAAAAPPVVVPPSQSKNGKATPPPKPKIKTCKGCGGILRRYMNHTCPPPTQCIDCGIAEYDHNCPPDEANPGEPLLFGAPVPPNICAFHHVELLKASRLDDQVSGKAVSDAMSATYGCAKCHPELSLKGGKPHQTPEKPKAAAANPYGFFEEEEA